MKIKVALGILISIVFIYLSFRNTNFHDVLDAVRTANYIWLVPAGLAMLLSHWLRAVRWHYIFEPIKSIKTVPLFSALIIGYAANNIFPLRAGEFLRAYAIGKSQDVSKTSSFATIVVDRLLDILALLVLMAASVYFLPAGQDSEGGIFAIVKQGAYLISAATVIAIAVMILLMQKTDQTMSAFQKVLPQAVFDVFDKVIRSFLKGFMVLRKSEHYFVIFVLSIAVWLLYAFTVFFSFFAFDYELGFGASLVVLVIISLGIMIPASPGFVGTYHWFCKSSLAIYGIAESSALGFAVIGHALNTIPFTILGLWFFWRENLTFSVAMAEKEASDHEQK